LWLSTQSSVIPKAYAELRCRSRVRQIAKARTKPTHSPPPRQAAKQESMAPRAARRRRKSNCDSRAPWNPAGAVGPQTPIVWSVFIPRGRTCGYDLPCGPLSKHRPGSGVWGPMPQLGPGAEPLAFPSWPR
jgi:hypothetical protein